MPKHAPEGKRTKISIGFSEEERENAQAVTDLIGKGDLSEGVRYAVKDARKRLERKHGKWKRKDK